jgi:16S rRNA (uracil1498-N3)-methyltransferase
MQIFYAPDISDNTHTLDETESKHLIRVLRMARGGEVKLIDGRGNLLTGIIQDPDQRRCIIEITSVVKDFEKRNYSLHIAISPLKNPERFEWFIEKSVEIGVDEITPIICRNTEKSSIKVQRINNLIISAMKQSLKATKTVFNEPCGFGDILNRGHEKIRMIAHCNTSLMRHGISEVYQKNMNSLILIGRNGGKQKLYPGSSRSEQAENRNGRHCCLPFHLLHKPVIHLARKFNTSPISFIGTLYSSEKRHILHDT